MRMPFGDFKGVDLEDVPTGYLQWVAENVVGRAELVSEIEKQLTMRRGEGVPRSALDDVR
jgi:uncharacterized protein (DUF3820 family)